MADQPVPAAECVRHCFCSAETWTRTYTCCRCRLSAIKTGPDIVWRNGRYEFVPLLTDGQADG